MGASKPAPRVSRDNLEGINKRKGARVVETAKLRHPGHLGLDHVLGSRREKRFTSSFLSPWTEGRCVLASDRVRSTTQSVLLHPRCVRA
eukprot:6011395-Prymnesium_polylepis.1